MSEENKEKITFTIEKEHFESNEEKLTAKNIIALAKDKDIVMPQDKIEDLTLKSSSGAIYSGDDIVDLSKDDHFILGIIYRFTVNGKNLETSLDKIVARDIIEIAQKKGVPLPATIENTILEVVGEDSEFKNEDWVDLNKFKEFLLIPSTPTPVA